MTLENKIITVVCCLLFISFITISIMESTDKRVCAKSCLEDAYGLLSDVKYECVEKCLNTVRKIKELK